MLSSGCVLFALAGLLGCASSAPTHGAADQKSPGRFDWNKIKHVVAFGNSYTYVQGSAGRQSYSFIGDYLPSNFSFTPEELLDNKIIANYSGTSAGGPNWIEFLTHCGDEPGEYTPTQCGELGRRELWDFAFAGANYADQLLPLHHDFTIPMVNQTQQYLTWAEPILGPRFDSSLGNSPTEAEGRENTLVAIWIGINDINDLVVNGDGHMSRKEEEAEYKARYDEINAALFEQSVAPLYRDAGFTNFLFMGLPPYNRTPANLLKLLWNKHPSKDMVAWWNESLKKQMRLFEDSVAILAAPTTPGLAGKLPTMLYYDVTSFLNNILDNPRKSGFKNTLTVCADAKNPEVVDNPGKFGCLPMEDYFWFDAGHITSHVHKLMAADVEKFLQTSSPP